MPDDSADDKTEDATPYRKQKEREKGRVAKSKDLASALILLISMLLLYAFGEGMFVTLAGLMVRFLRVEISQMPVAEGKDIVALAVQWTYWGFLAAVPFLVAILIVALLAHMVQTGPVFASEAIKLDLNRLNPISGLQRIFSLKGLMTLVMNLGKLLIVVIVVWVTLSVHLPKASMMARETVSQMVVHAADSVFTLGLRLSFIFFILGVLDFLYQLYQHNKDIRMTKQEVKDEMKMQEGDPHIRARRRQIQREMAQNRMMQEVPEAEVVVRNPTHYAVAIRYKPELAAPTVVAKGKGKIAEKIIELARESGVPTWRDPPLARQLYKIEVGDVIPPALFNALAEILASVLTAEQRAQYLASMQNAA